MELQQQKTPVTRHAGFALLLCLVLGFAVIGLPGCDRDGPAENAGERLDEAVDDIGDAAEEAADEAEDAADEVEERLDETAG